MSDSNAFQILAKKNLIGLAYNKTMLDNEFAKDLARLLIKHGADKEELAEILKDIKDSNLHNVLENKNKDYVYNRFELFDENLNPNKTPA